MKFGRTSFPLKLVGYCREERMEITGAKPSLFFFSFSNQTISPHTLENSSTFQEDQ